MRAPCQKTPPAFFARFRLVVKWTCSTVTHYKLPQGFVKLYSKSLFAPAQCLYDESPSYLSAHSLTLRAPAVTCQRRDKTATCQCARAYRLSVPRRVQHLRKTKRESSFLSCKLVSVRLPHMCPGLTIYSGRGKC